MQINESIAVANVLQNNNITDPEATNLQLQS